MNTNPNPEPNVESPAVAALVAIVPLSPRTGKIARLPHEVRRQINNRLRVGQSGTVILRWLTALPEVLAVVAAETRPEVKWERLQSLSREVGRLRRGDFQAERAALDRKRLEMEEANAIHRREKELWKWTERENIHAKLHPDYSGGLTEEQTKELLAAAQLL